MAIRKYLFLLLFLHEGSTVSYQNIRTRRAKILRVGNQLLEYRVDLKPDLVKSFSEFLHVYERYDN